MMSDDAQASVDALPQKAHQLMTLRRAVALFPRPWIDGDVTFQEWLLAAAVIQAAIDRDETGRL